MPAPSLQQQQRWWARRGVVWVRQAMARGSKAGEGKSGGRERGRRRERGGWEVGGPPAVAQAVQQLPRVVCVHSDSQLQVRSDHGPSRARR